MDISSYLFNSFGALVPRCPGFDPLQNKWPRTHGRRFRLKAHTSRVLALNRRVQLLLQQAAQRHNAAIFVSEMPFGT